MKMNCENLWRTNKVRSCLIRVCFYGLFLAGPYFISGAHAICVHKRIAIKECLSTKDKDEIAKQYYIKEKVMLWAGIGCSSAWIIWLVAAVITKLCSTKGLTRK